MQTLGARYGISHIGIVYWMLFYLNHQLNIITSQSSNVSTQLMNCTLSTALYLHLHKLVNYWRRPVPVFVLVALYICSV